MYFVVYFATSLIDGKWVISILFISFMKLKLEN
jgi:hypothetical protein